MFQACLVVALCFPFVLAQNSSPGSLARKAGGPLEICGADFGAASGLNRLRPATPFLRDVIQEACARSPGFRNVLSRLGRHDGFVYLSWTSAPMNGLRGALLNKVIMTPNGSRCLFVLFRNTANRPRLAGTIAHELQHAVEALQSTATNAVALEKHFRTIGHGDSRVIETNMAVSIGHLVERDMR